MKYISAIKSLFDLILGFVLSKLRPRGRGCYIVASNYGKTPDPNSTALIRHLLSNDQKVIVVSNEFKNLGDDQVVRVVRGTVMGAYYFFCCDVCFYTHSLSDVIPQAHRMHFLSRVFRFPKLVFMQHGVIGLKRRLSNGVSMADYVRRLEPTFDKILVSSKSEARMVVKFGIKEEKVAITGLPRFDLYSPLDPLHKRALIFFTWQSERSLNNKIKEVLESEGIRRLRQSGYTIHCEQHNMQMRAEDNEDKQKTSIHDLVATCSVLITDDSSVAWDVLYRGGNVLFFKSSDDWLSDNDALEKMKCNDVLALNSLLCSYLEGPDVSPLRFTEYFDNKNCERVYLLAKGML